MLIPRIFLVGLNKIKNNHNVKTNRYTEIVSSCLPPLSRRKYVAVWPPLITQDFWFVNKMLIKSIKFSRKPYFLILKRNSLFNESKAFSKCAVTRQLVSFLQITDFNYMIYLKAGVTNKSVIYISCLSSIM